MASMAAMLTFSFLLLSMQRILADTIDVSSCQKAQHKIVTGKASRLSLALKYQEIEYNSSQEIFRMNVSFTPTNICQYVKVEVFSSSEIIYNRSSLPLLTLPPHDANASLTVNISTADLNVNKTDSDHYFRLTAVDMYGRLCSDDLSNQTFYRFLRSGIPHWSFQNHSSIIRLPVPETKCNLLTFVWPKEKGGKTCLCPISTLEIVNFDDCARSCDSKYQLEYISNSIVFYNINSTSDILLTHFLCDTNPCVQTHGSCFTDTIITSHRVSLNSVAEADVCEQSSCIVCTPLLLTFTSLAVSIVSAFIAVIITCAYNNCRKKPHTYTKMNTDS